MMFNLSQDYKYIFLKIDKNMIQCLVKLMYLLRILVKYDNVINSYNVS